MIFFRPKGGLCNRMKALNTMLQLVENKNITVVWVNDEEMNCNLSSLFEMAAFDNVKIIEFSRFTNILNKWKCKLLNYMEDTDNQFIRKLLFRILIKNISINDFLLNKDLRRMYDSIGNVRNQILRETDANFSQKIKVQLQETISNNCYISSCYSMTNIDTHYQKFKPINELQDKINITTTQFSQTIGLHIRQGDHEISKEMSTFEKFEKVIQKELMKNNESTFFVATDSDDVKQKLIEKYKQKIITNSISSFNRSSQKAIESAVIDLYCLSKTEKIYGSHFSTYTQVAADIGGIEDEIVK